MTGTAAPHWAGWGEPGAHPLSPHALGHLRRRLGAPLRPAAAPQESAVRLGAPRLDAADLAALAAVVGAGHVRTDRTTRLAHAGGKSYLDLLQVRSGGTVDAPDAVVLPAGEEQVERLLRCCAGRRVAVVPFGGGTSVVGGVAPLAGAHRAVVAVDLARLDRLVTVDPASRLAVVQAGMRGPALELALAAHGLTLGHTPQSWEFASVGGYAATRSAGQASTGVGRFDELVEAVRLVTPTGVLAAGRPPASAAGPDLRALVLGSEGAFGIITEVTLRVHPLPERERYTAFALPSFGVGCAAFRALHQAGAGGDVMRLSDTDETEVALALAGLRGARALALRGYLAARGARRPCLAVLGFSGTPSAVRRRHARASAVLREAGAVPLGGAPARRWRAGRFAGPYQRDELLAHGVLAETLETAATWTGLVPLYQAVRAALQAELSRAGTPPLVMCHVSHVYPTGASLYFTVLAAQRRGAEAEQWRAAKRAASEAIAAQGATITHHHAVGTDHAPWLGAEIGELGLDVLRAVKARLDPTGICNPGKLIGAEPAPTAPTAGATAGVPR